MSQYKSPFNLPDEHMRMVGIIAAHWECFELVLNRAVAFVTDNEYGKIIILSKYMGLHSKLDLILAYGEQIKVEDPDLYKEFKQTIHKIRNVNSMRNTFVHAVWHMEEDELIPSKWDLRLRNGKLNESFDVVPIENLENTAKELYEAGDVFTQMMIKVGMKADIGDQE